MCNDCSTFTAFCQCVCPYCGNKIDSACNCSKDTVKGHWISTQKGTDKLWVEE